MVCFPKENSGLWSSYSFIHSQQVLKTGVCRFLMTVASLTQAYLPSLNKRLRRSQPIWEQVKNMWSDLRARENARKLVASDWSKKQYSRSDWLMHVTPKQTSCYVLTILRKLLHFKNAIFNVRFLCFAIFTSLLFHFVLRLFYSFLYQRQYPYFEFLVGKYSR